MEVDEFLFALQENFEERNAVAVGHTLDDFRNAVKKVKLKYIPYSEGIITNTLPINENYNLYLPPWLCQSYVRLPPAEHLQKLEKHIKMSENNEIQKKYYDDRGQQISRKLMKKLRRVKRRPHKPEGHHERNTELCGVCSNPIGLKCEFKLCRKCCRDKCYLNILDCKGHRILIKSKKDYREKTCSVPEKLLKLI